MTIVEGHRREKPSDAFKADVPMTSLTIATVRNIQCICVTLSIETPNVKIRDCALLRNPA
jgi:hypothetical protein